MPTAVATAQNPYLYQSGPTVPLQQQLTGQAAASPFTSRGGPVYRVGVGAATGRTYETSAAIAGRSSAIASQSTAVFGRTNEALGAFAPQPSLSVPVASRPTASIGAQGVRSNISGSGLVGAAVGGAVVAGSVYAQGGGLFQGLGAGLGSTVGAIGGQAAGAAAGAAVGGAAGSAVPGVGNVAGAGAGTVVGAIGGGLAGGAVGGSVGGGVGRSIDDFFWPDPGEPAIGIPGQPAGASPKPARGAGTPSGALGGGPVETPSAPIYGEPPFPGGQMAGINYRVRYSYTYNTLQCNGLFPESGTSGGVVVLTNIYGPVSYQSLDFNGCPDGASFAGLQLNHRDISGNPAQTSLAVGSIGINFTSFSYTLLELTRADGLPDTGGDPLGPYEGDTEPDRAPNPARVPYRPFGTDGAISPFDRTKPTPTPNDLPWPEREANPVPDADPFVAPSPFRTPEPGPNFTPTPAPAPAPAPTRPTDPFNPGPGGPLPEEDPERRTAPPFFIPIPVPTQPLGNPDFKTPTVPVPVPNGFQQPATTPTGSPQQLINPTTAPQVNPNVQPQPTPTPQPNRIEQGNCCIPPPDPELVRRLEEIKKGIGFQGLPVSVPDQIAKQTPGQIQIGSLAELHLWQVKQLDGVMGRWPAGIPIPTPTGVVNVGMPNMAEAVAEMVGMMVSQQVTATQILNTSSRALVQAGSATQQAHLAHLVAKGNAEFLGYESRPTQVDMPLAFTPGSDPFDGMLNESTQKIRGFENTDGQDIKAIFAELLQAAAIIRAVYWRKLDPKGDLRKQLKDQLRGQSDFIDKAAAGDGDDSDWQEYLKAVEEGFRGATGDANPYNRRPDEGPQIKDRSPGKDGK